MSRRDTVIAKEKVAWDKTIAYFVETARIAGYTITPLTDGAWRITKDTETTRLSSDCELYLYLVDRQVITVNRLYPRPGVGE